MSVPRIARYTWARHWPAAACEGLGQGVIGLSFFAVKRSLGGPDWAVPFVIVLWQVGWVFTPAVSAILARTDPQRLWRRIAWWAAVPMVLVALVDVAPTGEPGHGSGNLALFLVLTFLLFATAVVTVPHRGALVRANYPPAVRGRMYGLFWAVMLATSALAAKLAGNLLDDDPRWLRVIFPVAAVYTWLGLWLTGRIRWRHQKRASIYHAVAEGAWASMRRASREALSILRRDRHFRTYQIGFMLYGVGFLCSVGLLVLYAESKLALSYDEWTWARFVSFPIAQVLATPFVGRISDRLGVTLTAAVSFVVLAGFFAAMPFVTTHLEFVGAYALWGVAMAGVSVGWGLGPLHYAPDGKAHMYTAIHFSMVGIRSIFAPFLGLLMRDYFSYGAAFSLSVALLVLAALTLWRLAGASDGLRSGTRS